MCIGEARRGRRPAAFFDRDGVINVDYGYVAESARFELIAGAAEALRLCRDAGFWVFVVTNQAGVARGYHDEAAVLALHAHMRAVLAQEGAAIDDIRYCPHYEAGSVAAYARGCDCRKPAAGMLLDLAERWPVNMARSFLIGDKKSDVAAARAAGIAGFLFDGGDLVELVRRATAAAER